MHEATHYVLCCRCFRMRPAEAMRDLPEGYVCTKCLGEVSNLPTIDPNN